MEHKSLASDARSTGRVAFVSGHIDIKQESFLEHYKSALDAAIEAGDRFVLSNAGGADSLALEYLVKSGVDPSRITVYIHTPPDRRKNETMRRIDESRTGKAILEKYDMMGLDTMIIDGWHAERDAAMTADSDYDILWVRPEEETRSLYGDKYRAGRVSGTQKNRERRLKHAAEREMAADR